MATVQSEPAAGLVEAVIISGPKKGAIVQVRDDNHVLSDDYVLTPEEERAFDALQAQADRCVETAKGVATEMRGLLEDVRAIRRVLRNGTT
jgi:hypothetical protein